MKPLDYTNPEHTFTIASSSSKLSYTALADGMIIGNTFGIFRLTINNTTVCGSGSGGICCYYIPIQKGDIIVTTGSSASSSSGVLHLYNYK